MFKSPKNIDAIILSLFVALITCQPFFLRGELNLFELGIYLPGINAVLDGAVPYRDFFHLRGPLELYIPAGLMAIFSENIAVLSAYFYFGTVCGLVLCVWIAKEVLPSRFLFYLFVPILVGRTFPRVVFTFWGGMRFAWGLLAIYFLIRFIKRGKNNSLTFAGISSACALLTSVEVGMISLISIVCTAFTLKLIKPKENDLSNILVKFFIGFIGVYGTYLVYLATQNALLAYLDSTYYCVVNMRDVFPQLSSSPRNIIQYLGLMVDVTHKNFRHITPVYCYIFAFVYFFIKGRNKQFDQLDICIIGLWFYGLGLYAAAFRNIWALQFEMALQPEKIILFFLLYQAFLYLRDGAGGGEENTLTERNSRDVLPARWVKSIFYSFMVVVFMSSVCYSIMRFNRRFIAFQMIKSTLMGKGADVWKNSSAQAFKEMTSPRLKGVFVPNDQGSDFEKLTDFTKKYVSKDETILMFPEMASYFFIIDRPFPGKFPMVTFSWMKDDWHKEFMHQILSSPPRFAFIPKQLTPNFENNYFTIESNVRKFDQVAGFIKEKYQLVGETKNINIYKHIGQ